MRAVLILMWAVLAVPAAGQEPLAELWTRLEAVASLDELAGVGIPPGADAAVADALVRLRRYELGRDRTDAVAARARLERLTTGTASASAWAHFALGVTLARGPDVRIVRGAPELYFVSASSNAARQAPRSLRRALQLDPALHEAAYVLAEHALDVGDRSLMAESLNALSHATRATQPRALALQSRLMAALDDLHGAGQAALSLARAGGDASLSAHLRAAAMLREAGREAEGARVYFEGVDALSATSAHAFFEAVAATASASALERWSAADLDGRREWLRRFWRVQAALSGRPVEERLAEHYRRLAIVLRDGRAARMGADGVGLLGDLRGNGISDLRELLVLRHGDPVRAERVYHCGSEVLGMPPALAPSLEECARSTRTRSRGRSLDLVRAERLAMVQAAAAAVEGTTDYPPFRTHLSAVHELLQFRGAAGRTTLVGALGVPVADAHSLVQGDVLTARLEFAVIDTAAGTVDRNDVERSFRAGALPRAGFVLLSAELSLEPAAHRLYRIGVMDPDRVTGRVLGGVVEIRSHEGAKPTLSDLVVAPQDGAPSFGRGAVLLSLAPARTYAPDERFTLYYEIYGLVPEEAVRTDIEVRPEPAWLGARMRQRLPGASGALRLSFADVAPPPHEIYGMQQMRSVALPGLAPGRYTLQVRVTDAGGRSATRARTLIVGGS